ncbi:MAG: pentapeptide repeat-containing protein [Cyanobacteria bacterium P01_G01_bin.39]
MIAAVIAAVGLFVNYQDAVEDRRLTQERLVTDRFAKAVEQLGNSKEEVIIGGIYSLERIAKDSPKDQWTIMEVLTAFVRKNSPIPPEIEKLEDGSEEKLKVLEKLEPVNIQVQAALTVIERRNPKQDYTSDEDPELNNKRLDLSHSNLTGANLSYADLTYANLSYANLSGANLSGADLSYADLRGAGLFDALFTSANFIGADLRGVNLIRANFSGADLSYADLRGTGLFDANFSGTYLSGADLNGTYLGFARNLSSQQIKSACFWEKAIFTDAKLKETLTIRRWVVKDEKANQRRIKEIKQDKASDPVNPPDCRR